MNAPTPPIPPSGDLRTEVDTRLVQALENFFQRNRPAIHDGIQRALASEPGPSLLAAGQDCTDWLAVHPDQLSDAFAARYRSHLARDPETAAIEPSADSSGELSLLDDATLERQLTVNKSGLRLTDALFPDMQPFLARMMGLLDRQYAGTLAHYSPPAIVRALSDALDDLGLEARSGTLLLQQATRPLQDSLRHTYVSLAQFLESRGIAARESRPLRAADRCPESSASAGSDVLAHIQRAAESGVLPAAQRGISLPGDPTCDSGHPAQAATHVPPGFSLATGSPGVVMVPTPGSFLESLDHWQITPPASTVDASGAPVLVLRQLQTHAQATDAAHFDLAMLDAVACLFEFILADTDVSSSYKSAIARMQIPVLRVALATPDFFSDDSHPARRTLDLLGLFSRRFPETHHAHPPALAEVETVCNAIAHQPARQTQAFADALTHLNAWLDAENARADVAMSADVARLEQVERQELGTLLALETLQDLTARHPAPTSVLRQLERAWIPYMAALYVEESGEGPAWREASSTLLNLFLSLQAPADEATREKRLQTLPKINSALRNGLLSQHAEPGQLREFFAAITATQECWIRPEVGHHETPVSHFEPSSIALISPEAPARRAGAMTPPDTTQQQADALREGDWVDFSPPYEGLETARVAWVGVQGYLLFCDSDGETRFSLDTLRLAEAIRAGQATVPEQSLTRKAMLRLREQLQTR